MSKIKPTLEPILICDRCGEEAYVKLIGDEVYDWCDECGCVEDNTHAEY